MRSPLRLVHGLLAVACYGCATAGHPPASEPAPAQPRAETPYASGQAAGRELGPDATFGDLTRAARLLGEQRAGESSLPCLLTGTATGYRLSADLLAALDGLPDAPTELDSALQSAQGALAVLGAFGVVGDRSAELSFASFTAVSPDRLRDPFALIALTDEGVYVRRAPASAQAAASASEPEPLAQALARLSAAGPAATCYVSAESNVALRTLAELLRALPSSCQTALATALPLGTRLPAAPTATALLCPDGLPSAPADAAEGTLSVPALRDALAAIRPSAQRCLERASSVLGAEVTIAVALRIDAGGAVADACVLSAPEHAGAVPSCVLDAVRSARFPPPSPPGLVDVHVPLRLSPAAWPMQRAYCEE